MDQQTTRRRFLAAMGAAAGIGAFAARADDSATSNATSAVKREYGISLAAWSLHRSIGEGEGKYPMLEMPRLAREEFEIEAIELVNRMLAEDTPEYLEKFKQNAIDHTIKILLIMIDGEGDIGAPSENMRERAILNHKKWIDIAEFFGCHSVRMNWKGHPNDVMQKPEELTAFIERSVPGLRALAEYGDTKNINVIIENHGGPSSYPEPMERLMKAVGHSRFGTLPDFGNFPPEVDIYDAVDRLMPYAKAVSAKCYDFDLASGKETKLDYERLLQIVHDKHGYKGYIGIEYEGAKMSEFDGIKACRDLLRELRGN